ncbi:MAG: lexA [Candidatus Adlerbacteria bacterium]|nr:lexA [Candidatus Adlerbacteria bacterium]
MYDENKKKVIKFYKRYNRTPGYQEIMEMTGFRSKNAVFKLIEQLADDGVVYKDAHGKIAPKNIREGIKMLGLVEAGFPSPAEEELLDVVDFDEYLTPNKESSYILKVKGESMKDAGFMPGDMVIVERKNIYKPGDIVIACVDGEYTMKYLRKMPTVPPGRAGGGAKGPQYFLEPANKDFQNIYPGEGFRVEAVVTAVVRKY